MGNTILLSIDLMIAWLLYLVIQSIFINGIYLSSSGTTEEKPDGSDDDSEMFLYPLRKELLKKTTCKIFYNGERLKEIYANIVNRMPLLNGANVSDIVIHFSSTDQEEQFKQAQTALVNFLPPGAKHSFGTRNISFFKEYTVYKYSKWLRKPIIQCVVCMGSFYGIFLFLIPGLVVMHFNWIVLPGYLVNTVLLACMNKIVQKFT